MKRKKVGIIDLVSKGPNKTLWAKIMYANLASIMPQVVATWSEQQGHEVTFVCYTGREDLLKEMPRDVDIVFICAFTQSALLAYAISNQFRKKGTVTVLGGPHARCYPDDAMKYFDYVCGFTDQQVIEEILGECITRKPMGRHVTAKTQPTQLPGVQERWKFIEPTLKKAPSLKFVPMIASMGCPYTCSFCIDAAIPYQPLDFEIMKEDFKFLLTKFKSPWVAWHDPNFGIRINDIMGAIESAVPSKSIRFIAESSLSILNDESLKSFERNGFVAMLPGIESWYDMGNKSNVNRMTNGAEKLNRVSKHVNNVFNYITYMQTNFVMGLDCDEGPEPFELTKRFVDLAPGAFPGYSLLTAFGEAAVVNLEYQRDGRVIGFPFHFLNNHLAMNVKPKNYEWVEFYDHVIDVTEYTFSKRAIWNRIKATPNFNAKWMNFMRAISSEGFGRIRFFKTIRDNLLNDRTFRAYFEKETEVLPEFYVNIIKRDLGPMYDWLPEGALYHDPNAYLKKTKAESSEKYVQKAGMVNKSTVAVEE